jgi:arsenate reductase (thioredoxin)
MPSTPPVFNVLFLCTGNSARSIMAEAILNHVGRGRFQAFSAGSHPTGRVHPLALERLERHRHDTSGLRSKHWGEFAQADAPPMHFVLTVCDQAAGEACPLWPGQPITAHWGVPDPAAVAGDDAAARQAFAQAFMILSRRVALLLNLPHDKLDSLSLQRQLADIGRQGA